MEHDKQLKKLELTETSLAKLRKHQKLNEIKFVKAVTPLYMIVLGGAVQFWFIWMMYEGSYLQKNGYGFRFKLKMLDLEVEQDSGESSEKL